MKELNIKEKCIEIFIEQGFRLNNTMGGDFYKDFGGFDCLIWIDDKTIKLKVHAKSVGFADSAYIGPPLPDEQKLKAFIKYNTE